MPSILLFSDIHSDLKALEALMAIEADYYFAAGDLVNWAKGLDKVGAIMKPRAERMFVIPGNHESEGDIAAFCRQHGFIAAHGQSYQIGGHQVAALGYSNITPFDTPGEYSEPELERRLAVFADLKPLVLVCHCPPHATPLDAAGPGKHFGSPAVARFIAQHQPEHFFCGHIHESAGVSATLGRTQARNLGKKGFLLEL
ncbi:MAG: metallophosphoesterase [Acidobacteria bacterium]|nr:metallophosphoesterase [Acidobacteriota bacterium]